MGLTIAFGVQPALTVVGQHFKKRRALAMGLMSTGSALGGIGFPLMFDQLLSKVGFANSLRLAAVKTAYVSVSLPVVHELISKAFATSSLCVSLQAGPAASPTTEVSLHLSISEDFLTKAMLYFALAPGSQFSAFGSPHIISNPTPMPYMPVTRSASTSCAC
jgi:MFS family permease